MLSTTHTYTNNSTYYPFTQTQHPAERLSPPLLHHLPAQNPTPHARLSLHPPQPQQPHPLSPTHATLPSLPPTLPRFSAVPISFTLTLTPFTPIQPIHRPPKPPTHPRLWFPRLPACRVDGPAASARKPEQRWRQGVVVAERRGGSGAASEAGRVQWRWNWR